MDLYAAQKLAQAKMKEWDFRFDGAKRRLGCARFHRQHLTLSRHLTAIHSESEVLDTILHEIAHIKAGFSAGHGPKWQQWAVTVGAKPERCASAEVARLEPKFIVVCTLCTKIIAKRHRRSRRMARCYCRSCGISSAGKLTYQHNPKAGQVRS